MLRTHRFSTRHLSFVLAFLVALTMGLCPTTSLAQGETAFNTETPKASLQKANPTSDEALVDLAAQLMDARADAEISHWEYKQGVHYFRQHHPIFYGNFFGDPVYASYNIRYFQLARERQFVEYELNPENEIFTSASFLCHPSSYDPAFGGVCSGFAFQRSDFLVLPIFMIPDQAEAQYSLTADVERGDGQQTRSRMNRDGSQCATSGDEKAGSGCGDAEGDEESSPAPNNVSETAVRSIVAAKADRLAPVEPPELEERGDVSDLEVVTSASGRNLSPVHTNRRNTSYNDTREDRERALENIRQRLERATNDSSHEFEGRDIDFDRPDRIDRRRFESHGTDNQGQRRSRRTFDRSDASDFDRPSRANNDRSQNSSEPNIRSRGELDPNG